VTDRPSRGPLHAWVFDLDGTLTVAVHDFDGLKQELSLDPSRPLLEGLQALEGPRADAAWARVAAWERDHAALARPAEGVEALLEALRRQGRRLGVLTRNTREVALLTLAGAGLSDWFAHDDVLGRNCAAPKPAPDGVLRLLRGWRVGARDAVMVGDAPHDAWAGMRAGAIGVWLHGDDEPGRDDVDLALRDVPALHHHAATAGWLIA
jgi:HAD superfamily hydrolase (TIGR01509 family)